MSAETNIAWADSTASPWFGCTEVSPGCVNCYARELTEQKFAFLNGSEAGFMRLAYKRDGLENWDTRPVWGDKATRVRSKGFEKNVLAMHRKPFVCALCRKPHAGVNEQGLCPVCGCASDATRRRIFASLMDWLDPQVPIEWLADFLKLINEAPNLDWLLLTKRPELFNKRMGNAIVCLARRGGPGAVWVDNWKHCGKAPANVWVGVTVEDQKRADERIPELLKIPARVRWLSVEPLLERVDIFAPGCRPEGNNSDCREAGEFHFDWVVVGGESGRKRRDCGCEAIVNVAEQCQAAGVPVWVKQDCASRPGQKGRIPYAIWNLKQLPG